MLAVFDLDETLIGADCASLWVRYMVDQGWAGNNFIEAEAFLMEKYYRGELDMADYMLFTLKPMIGMSLDDIRRHGEKFAKERVAPLMYEAAKKRVSDYLNTGKTVIVVSASAEFIVRPIAALFGVSNILGINVECDDQGCLTGRTEGVLTFREGKITRLKAWLEGRAETLEDASFYSDSANDLPLLEVVGFPHVVNPDPRLASRAQQGNWPVLNWE